MGVRKFDGGLELPKAALGSRPLDRDKLAMTTRLQALRVALEAFHPVQSWEVPEEQVLGLAVLFATMARRCGLDPEFLYTMACRVIDAPEDGDAPTANMQQVLTDYMGSRIMSQEVSVG